MQSDTSSSAPRRRKRTESDNDPPWENDEMLRAVCEEQCVWRNCRPRCRRAHACTGAPFDCFASFWTRGSEARREWLRAYFAARRRGLNSPSAAQSATALRRRAERRERERAALWPGLAGVL